MGQEQTQQILQDRNNRRQPPIPHLESSTIGSQIRHRQSLESDSACAYTQMEQSTRIGILHQASMNAEKVAASMVSLDRLHKAFRQLKLLGLCRLNNEWLTLISSCSLAASNLGHGSCVPTEVLYHRTVTSKEVQNRFGLAYSANNGNLLSTRFRISHQARRRTAGSATLPPLPTSILQEHPIRMRNCNDPMSSLNRL